MSAPKKVIEEHLNQAIISLPQKDQKQLLIWAKAAKGITDDHSLSRHQKLRKLIALESRKAFGPIVISFMKEAKRLGWDERSWFARLGGSGLLVGVGTFGGGAIGLASSGFGIGISAALLTAVGGAFIGGLIDRLEEITNVASKNDAVDVTETKNSAEEIELEKNLLIYQHADTKRPNKS